MEIKRTALEKLAEIEPREAFELGSKVKVSDEEVFVTHPKNIQIHSIANILPKMTENEYISLKESIKNNGQLVPVYLYRGKLVDGRHRLKALSELGSNVIKYTKLPNNWTLEQVKEFILGTEQRRHETKAQLAIRAYFDYKKNGGSQQEIATKYGIDRTDISRAKKIEEKLGTDMLKKLLNERKVKLSNGRYYSNLKSIVSFINKLELKTKEFKTNEEPPTKLAKEAEDVLNKAFNIGDLDTILHVIKTSKKLLDLLMEK